MTNTRGCYLNIIRADEDFRLKILDNYSGPVPQVGQKITFFSGEGVFEVVEIRWATSKEDWYSMSCNVVVRELL